MITISELVKNFYPVEELHGGIVRCADELPKKVFYTYFMLDERGQKSPFVISEDVIDDDFARMILNFCGGMGSSELEKMELSKNQYGFTHFLRVPCQYHFELKGRLDLGRPNTILCIPIFDAEFSGSETLDEFIDLRRNIVATLNWHRKVTPKITLRFDNGKTMAGTGDGYVFAKFDQVLREVENLAGVSSGFIELMNFNARVVEIVSAGIEDFSWIPDRDDAKSERIPKDAIQARLWHFLTN